MNIFEKLTNIQTELKAPKNQYNSFGNYKYRSCEDILEGLKPLLLKYKCSLYFNTTATIEEDLIHVQGELNFIDYEKQGSDIVLGINFYDNKVKKGMNISQCIGACTSYAKKYVLSDLFCIDDTKDVDSEEFQSVSKEADKKKEPKKTEKKSYKPKGQENQFNEVEEERKQLLDYIGEMYNTNSEYVKTFAQGYLLKYHCSKISALPTSALQMLKGDIDNGTN